MNPLQDIAQAPYLRRRLVSDLAGQGAAANGFQLLSRSQWPQLDAIAPQDLQPLFGQLEPDLFDVHRTRRRARAKFDFHVTRSGDIYLCESATATIFDKTGYRGPREHLRIQALHAPGVGQLCELMISLAVRTHDYRCGYVGLDIFRTVDDVVYGFHQDGEHFVGIYCVRRACDGARTLLARDKAGTALVLDQVLNEGDMLFFDDQQLFHHTTNLEPKADGAAAERDVLILTLSGIV